MACHRVSERITMKLYPLMVKMARRRMRPIWRFIDDGPAEASYNMALDEAIARTVLRGEAPPTLRLYTWALPSVSMGCFQRVRDIDTSYCNANEIPLVRRPTGGRAILHDMELTYSFSAREAGPFSSGGVLGTYAALSRALSRALKALGIDVQVKSRRERGRVLARSALCFQSVSYGELSVDNRKVVGSAQKRWKEGFLQQGSIQLRVDTGKVAAVFRDVDGGGIGTLMTGLMDVKPALSVDELRLAIRAAFEETFEVRLASLEPSAGERDLALRLQEEKYRSPEWTFSR